MGSFFVVQVQTGSEIVAKEMLKGVLNRAGDTSIKSIYAMESYTDVSDADSMNLEELSQEDVCKHLKVKKMSSGLSNMKNAYQKLKESYSKEHTSLLESYRENIRSLAAELKEFKSNSKKIGSLLSGYILIELTETVFTIPNAVWHTVKNIPKVIGFPSKNDVPQYEIEHFFQEIDMSQEVELELEEMLSVEEIEQEKADLLYTANQEDVVGTEEEKEIMDQIDDLDVNIEEEMNDMIEDEIMNENAQSSNHWKEFKELVASIKLKVKQKRKIVQMPIRLFRSLCLDKENTPIMKNSRYFLEKLRTLIHANFVGRVTIE